LIDLFKLTKTAHLLYQIPHFFIIVLKNLLKFFFSIVKFVARRDPR